MTLPYRSSPLNCNFHSRYLRIAIYGDLMYNKSNA